MPDTICMRFHGKRHSDFDLKRIARAEAQGFDKPVTAYLCGAFIKARTGVGVVFGHPQKDQFGRFDDGHLMRTSDVVTVERKGRFWVITTESSRYVIATFQRQNGRASLREFLGIASGQHHLAPKQLQ
ncbi:MULTISPECIES: hypothetical protein [Pseudomonas]|uniref:Uncharacterized protein n=1 Tax=Pseudomonas putida (strain ATCC 47054 / DSM 6125 / CFBP 8728 / NCIMB 11950 / KT2440) TaxID=160488 RepID=A0A140FWP2_PSEPK|nr:MULTISPECIES: hypothetical protein [Pseudomonas]AMM03025.1 conserved protein of unknown function [Pseudomonas putida KT2440]KMU96446.1 hypothetical protein AC138_09195 [Pseudomonas putida]KMY28636.1 hypothetical protein AA993_22645 [Pseudomonas putida]MDD2080551.1 hypothetical protein [Pseudomonas putida]PXZ48465.1 hypothetical protein DM483_16970 [Pseudomonas sp. SMT-1]